MGKQITSSASAKYKSLTKFPEYLLYDISWGPITVGQADLSVRELVDFSSRPAYHIMSQAQSNKFCDAFYKVRDFNESWLDATNLTSLGYSKILHEGSFFRNEWTVFDPDQRRYLGKITDLKGHYQYKSGATAPEIEDILSSLYYIRSRPLAPGDSMILNVNTRKNWPLIVRAIRREKIRTPLGTFDTILVEPKIRREGIFIQKGKDLKVWLTNDERRMPVLMEVEILFGHVTAKLVKMVP